MRQLENNRVEVICNQTLIHGECLYLMDKLIEQGVIVDVIDGEIWKPVLKLFSYYNTWKIKDEYTFNYREYFVSNKGRFIYKGKLKNNKPDKKLNIVYSLQGKRFKIHQIVMQTFQPDGIKDFYSVDHIDRTNRLNNNLENLRWANRDIQYLNRENKLYKYKKILCHQNKKIYNSCQEVENDLGLVKNTVSRVARKDRKSIHGYTFEYVE